LSGRYLNQIGNHDKTALSVTVLVRISSEIAEVMSLLEVRLFRLPADFLSSLSEVRMVAVGPAAPVLQASEDLFAPGMELIN
jgi:hypothetical protein